MAEFFSPGYYAPETDNVVVVSAPSGGENILAFDSPTLQSGEFGYAFDGASKAVILSTLQSKFPNFWDAGADGEIDPAVTIAGRPTFYFTAPTFGMVDLPTPVDAIWIRGGFRASSDFSGNAECIIGVVDSSNTYTNHRQPVWTEFSPNTTWTDASDNNLVNDISVFDPDLKGRDTWWAECVKSDGTSKFYLNGVHAGTDGAGNAANKLGSIICEFPSNSTLAGKVNYAIIACIAGDDPYGLIAGTPQSSGQGTFSP